MTTISIPSHGEMTVRRPNGEIEIVRTPIMSAKHVEASKIATAKAGRGEILSYIVINKDIAEPMPTAADLASDAHVASRRAIERASATGERNESVSRTDRTPYQKGDEVAA